MYFTLKFASKRTAIPQKKKTSFLYISAKINVSFEPSKEKKSKTTNARIKTRTVLKSALNSAQSYEARFSIFLTKIFLLQVKVKKKSVFWKKYFSVGRSSNIRIIRRKLKIWLHNFVQNSMQIQNMSLFLF